MGHQPVIVLGMHRSGTSMLARTLQDLGLFLGGSVDEHCEARFFISLNEWMLSEAGGRWDAPVEIPEELVERLEAVTRRHLGSWRTLFFLGGHYRPGRLFRMTFPWGWKDPRTVLNLAVWKRIFPGARWLHLYRHPLDVAESLRRRSRESLAPRRGWRRRISESTLVRWPPLDRSSRLLELEVGIDLWREYVSRAHDFCKTLPADQTLSLSYEDLVDQPLVRLAHIVSFLGLEADRRLLEGAAARIHSQRRFIHRRREVPLEAEESVRDDPLLRSLGYS
ncbi:MAG: sulfotransferase [Acidobacteria bacterium]|nr:MAG: sulfotransferase [Acidobacteriota bacterium]REK09792.1 MAG: sulfotransferase [Acidobacteriota bacterium]